MKIERLPHNPIISSHMTGLRWGRGNNINGPTLLRVPSWVPDPLGKYYLYFGHHNGQYIRLAYAEYPEGPYRIHPPGVLHLKDLPFLAKHIASPEIYSDPTERSIRLYYHANVKGTGIYADQGQMTYLAESRNGLKFTPQPGAPQLAPFYLRVFFHQGYYYGLAKDDNKDGILLRSQNGRSTFERGPTFMPGFRHCCLLQRGNLQYVFFTRVGDCPESILVSEMRLEGDWQSWTLSEPQLVLKPEMDWEGVNIPPQPSRYGSTKSANALRDPYLFEEEGKIYLYYCIKGEAGIAIAGISDISISGQ